MNKFTSFWRVYVGMQYRNLYLNTLAALQGLFYRQNSESWNQWLVYDHGILWRLLREVTLLISTAIRLVVGLAVFLCLIPLVPIAAVLRAAVIPLSGLCKGLHLVWVLRRSKDAR